MKKSLNIVLIGVLAVASIILALPFTPLRHSFKGVAGDAANKALTSVGVDFSGKIKNARRVSFAHQYQNTDIDLTDYLDMRDNLGVDGNYSNMNLSLSDGTYSATNMLTKDKIKGSAVGGGFAPGSLGKSGSNNSSQAGDFIAISSKLGTSNGTTTPNGSTKQSGNGQNNGTGGGTHPGVDPTPIPDPGPVTLPIGDGTYLMLFMLGIFGVYKSRKLIF